MEKFRYTVYILLGKGYTVESENKGFLSLQILPDQYTFSVCVRVLELLIYTCAVSN